MTQLYTLTNYAIKVSSVRSLWLIDTLML